MDADEDILTLEINTTKPIPVEAFNNSIRATANQLMASADGEAEVFVSEVRKDSFIVDLIAITQPSLQFVENVSTACNAIKNIKSVIDCLLNNDSNNKPSKRDVQDIKDITSPIANINVNINGNVNINNPIINMTSNSPNASNSLSISSEEAKRIHERIDEIGLYEPTADVAQSQTLYSKVPFYWCQAGFYKNQNQGNKGIIGKIDDKPHKVIFADDESPTKKEMTTTPQGQKNNWQNVDYIVDVEMLRVKGNIKWYKILKNYKEDAIDE